MYHAVKILQTIETGKVTKLHFFQSVTGALDFMELIREDRDVLLSEESPFEVEAIFVWSK